MFTFLQSIRIRFVVAFLFASCWMCISINLGYPWFMDLAQFFGIAITLYIVLSIALLPGFISAFSLASYILDKQVPAVTLEKYPAISILIAAYNEQSHICDVIASIRAQHYPGIIEIVIIDDGSTDATRKVVSELEYSEIKLICATHRGKANALNIGLANCSHDIVVTLDADTFLLQSALRHLVEHLVIPGKDYVASVGSVYVKNKDQSWITKLQYWDYLSGIATIKRIQSLFTGTLVAQGALSAFKKRVLLEANGWPISVVGEDIILTWSLIKKNYQINYAFNAIALTEVPSTYRSFFRQRSRWARGMLEAFKYNKNILATPRLTTFFIFWNMLFPFIDFANTFIFLPGIIAAFLGYPIIVSYCTLAYIPISLLNNFLVLRKQRSLQSEYGFSAKFKALSLVCYILFYSLLMSPACVVGYCQELARREKKWGTK